MTAAENGPDREEFPRARCLDADCGLEVIFTPDGWQHDCATWFVTPGHQPVVNDTSGSEALRYLVDHCPHNRADDLPEPGDRCKDCGIEITWVGPGPNDWEPAVGAIPWRKD